MLKKNNNHYCRFKKEIRKHISVILHNNINDPRVGMVTVSNIYVSKDLSYVKIFVTFFDSKKNNKVDMRIHVLQKASGVIRRLLSKVMYLRIIPEIVFFYDGSLLEGRRMCNLIELAVNRDIKLSNKK